MVVPAVEQPSSLTLESKGVGRIRTVGVKQTAYSQPLIHHTHIIRVDMDGLYPTVHPAITTSEHHQRKDRDGKGQRGCYGQPKPHHVLTTVEAHSGHNNGSTPAFHVRSTSGLSMSSPDFICAHGHAAYSAHGDVQSGRLPDGAFNPAVCLTGRGVTRGSEGVRLQRILLR